MLGRARFMVLIGGLALATGVVAVPAAGRPVAATLTVTVNGPGTVQDDTTKEIHCPDACRASFDDKARVTLTATTLETFVGWGGACSGTAITCTVDMALGDQSVTATFARQSAPPSPPAPSRLTVAVSGPGQVLDDLGQIVCPSRCAADYEKSPTVTLTAAPVGRSRFLGWGGECSGTGDCMVRMNADRSVTATFVATGADTSRLSVAVTGPGAVGDHAERISCPGTCSAVYDAKADVQLTATPAAGARFVGWSGACSGTGPCSVNMGMDQSVTATFAARGASTRPRLLVTVHGHGTVTDQAGKIRCPRTCTAGYGQKEMVTLIARPAARMRFAGWSGGCAETGACTVTMTAGALRVTATFRRR